MGPGGKRVAEVKSPFSLPPRPCHETLVLGSHGGQAQLAETAHAHGDLWGTRGNPQPLGAGPFPELGAPAQPVSGKALGRGFGEQDAYRSGLRQNTNAPTPGACKKCRFFLFKKEKKMRQYQWRPGGKRDPGRHPVSCRPCATFLSSPGPGRARSVEYWRWPRHSRGHGGGRRCRDPLAAG